jgi:cation diffusion facilitator family transporter
MAVNAHIKTRIIAISLSFFISLLLMAAKFYGYKITGSAAILSDALESIINVIASAFAFGSIMVASRPPDKDHPYGHGKIEYFSAGFEGALIMLAAIGIFMSGWPRIFHPGQLPNLDTGMLIILGTALMNLFLGTILIKCGKKTGSLALTADGKHILTDVYSTAAVLVGLLLVRFTGKLWMDGAAACLIGVNIL